MAFRILKSLALAALAFGAGSAAAETLPRMERNYAEFDRFAGSPIERVRNFRLHRWQPLGKYSLAIWTRVNEVYLIDVDHGCWGLDFTPAIGVTATVSTLYRHFDSVVFDNQRCRIERIRPVDYKAYRAYRKDVREREKAARG